MKRGSFFLTFGIFLAVVLGAYTGWTYFQNESIQVELKRLEKVEGEVGAKLDSFKSGNVEQSIIAQKTLGELEEETLAWSQILQRIIRTVPVDRGDEIVNILSYSGSGSKELAMSVKTVPGRPDPYEDVADFIRSFDESNDFVEGFVPSIGSTFNEDGDEILSFNYTVRYVGDEERSFSEPSVTEIPAPSVSRVVEVEEEDPEEELEDVVSDVLSDAFETAATEEVAGETTEELVEETTEEVPSEEVAEDGGETVLR